MESTDFISAQTSASAIPFVTHVTNTSNFTASFFSSTTPKDIALVPLRILARLDTAFFDTFPRFIGRTTGLERVTNRAAAVVAGYWAGNVGAVNTAAGGGAIADTAAQAVGEAAATAVGEATGRSWTALITEAFQTSTFKSYWGMLHYLTSRWAFACFVMALVLNRVTVYAAPRQRIFLTWSRRLALRVMPILLFTTQIRSLMQAIHCQTSPNFSLYRHGDINSYSLLDWSTEGGSIHKVVNTIMWWSDDEASCQAVGIGRSEPSVRAPSGSFALLWPTFLNMCLSHFIESLSCVLQGIPTQTEVGMSVFEHSLAFAEAETMITHALEIGMLASSKNATTTTTNSARPASMKNANLTSQGTIPASGTILAITDALTALSGPHILDRANVPIEVLLVALLSCGNALSSHIVSVLGQQRNLRLINTSFWGICFITVFIWGFFTTSGMVRTDGVSEPKPVSGLLHFPTVAIIGFLPHISIILGVVVCAIIYVLALTLTAVSLGTNPNIRQPKTLSERMSIAHDNLQAAIQAKGIKLKWSEDFYTALLRLGFAALTAASEAVFLNEGRSVEMKQFTWLEEERLDELQVSKEAFDAPSGGNFQIAEEYGIPPSYPSGSVNDDSWKSGYSKERKIEKRDGQLQVDGTYVYPNPRTDGVGALQRTARFYLLFIFVRGVFFTITGWMAFALGSLLDRIGITARPNWLRRMIGTSVKKMINEQKRMRDNETNKTLDFWMITDDGKLVLPSNDDMDIEPEMRKRVLIDTAENVDQVLEDKMYDWWKLGGWFGTADLSGDYQPPSNEADDEDATSVITTATNASSTGKDDESAWESESDGHRTPTQVSTTNAWAFSRRARTRSETPESVADMPLNTADLARLLNPPDSEAREEARILASHLSAGSSSRIITRSQYRRQLHGERSRILLAGRTPAPQLNPSSTAPKAQPLTQAEEAQVLESLLLKRRARMCNVGAPAPGTEEDEANRQTGPPCVVCQSSPRTIIAWPCRCLSLCEDCRVSLAMNNFGNCVTCRRNVGGFVRLYIP